MGVQRCMLDDVAVIRISGWLDGASAAAVRRAAYEVLLQRQLTVLVNMEDVPRIDAAGLGILAQIHSMAASVGGRVALTNLQSRVREMLDVAELSSRFDIAASECDAIEDYGLCALR
jgi:anti-anti-sigma factor